MGQKRDTRRAQEIASQLAEEFGRWNPIGRVVPTEVAALAKALARQDVDIGDIGIMCAVVGYLAGKKDSVIE
jgi:ABC-type phosphate/phosphonate transport system substrate-binding protein